MGTKITKIVHGVALEGLLSDAEEVNDQVAKKDVAAVWHNTNPCKVTESGRKFTLTFRTVMRARLVYVMCRFLLHAQFVPIWKHQKVIPLIQEDVWSNCTYAKGNQPNKSDFMCRYLS